MLTGKSSIHNRGMSDTATKIATRVAAWWKPAAVVTAVLLALLFVLPGRTKPDEDKKAAFIPEDLHVEKPSPIAPEVVPLPLEVKASADPEPVQRARRQSNEEGAMEAGPAEWSVVTATYKNYEAASRRAESLRRQWPPSKAKVYPPEGQGEKYMVLIGSNLTRSAAQELAGDAKTAGLPPDTYVTKLMPATSRQ